jgi:subtilisin family serine protease
MSKFPSHITSIPWNIVKINADEVWAKGFTGDGVVIGHLDTGVNYNHDDLKDHMWRNDLEFFGTASVDDDTNGFVDDIYGYDFYDEEGDPIDENGHGTHTAGTIAGDGTAGQQTGVAPDARIMVLKVTDINGNGFESDGWRAIQYAIDNKVDVISISLGWLHQWNPNRGKWREAFDNALQEGIIAAAAAGNERVGGDPPPDNIRTPGDVPPPWLHNDQYLQGERSGVVTVGATDALDNYTTFSSYGPVSWESWLPWNDYPYIPEMGLLDPDISAPGVSITSLSLTDNSGYVGGFGWSGTSMSTPHVAGVMALLLSANSELDPATLDYLIETSALDRGPSGKDKDYGSGRINALAALLADTVGNIPVTLSILPAFPNPFQASTTIQFDLPFPGEVKLKVYDIAGRLTKTIIDDEGFPSIGRFSRVWDGTDNGGNRVANGFYFVWLEMKPAGGQIVERASRKIVYIR